MNKLVLCNLKLELKKIRDTIQLIIFSHLATNRNMINQTEKDINQSISIIEVSFHLCKNKRKDCCKQILLIHCKIL